MQIHFRTGIRTQLYMSHFLRCCKSPSVYIKEEILLTGGKEYKEGGYYLLDKVTEVKHGRIKQPHQYNEACLSL